MFDPSIVCVHPAQLLFTLVVQYQQSLLSVCVPLVVVVLFVVEQSSAVVVQVCVVVVVLDLVCLSGLPEHAVHSLQAPAVTTASPQDVPVLQQSLHC